MSTDSQKPEEAGNVGIIKIKSQGEPNQRVWLDQHEFELSEKICRAKVSGNKEEAIKLIDSLIKILALSDRPTFELQIDKVLIKEPGKFTELIPIYEDQLNFHKKGNNLIEQFNTLLSLTAVSVNSNQFELANTYLQQAEYLLSNTLSKEISKKEETNSNLTPATLGGLRDRIEQAKSYIIFRIEHS